MLSIDGTGNHPPTAADQGVTAIAGMAYAFTADDFGFADDDAGDMLASVKIESLPAVGTLAVGGTAVTLDQEVFRTQIDGSMLTFTPVAGAIGAGYASFTFKVNDGSDDSADAYTMTIDARDIACGALTLGTRRNHWSGTLTVEAYETAEGEITFYGFYGSVGTGRLVPSIFSIGSNSYTIEAAAVTTGSPAGVLVVILSSSLTSAERAALKVHVCDTGFDFSAATHNSASYSYSKQLNLDWAPPVMTRTLYLSLPRNNAATGDPTISGTASVGHVLTADASDILDADGLPSTFTYRWIRVDADGVSSPEEIPGAEAATYTLTDDDAGKRIQVKATFTDNLSGMEMRTSEAYPTGTVNTAPTARNSAVTTHQDTPHTFSAADFNFDDADAGDTLASVKIVTLPGVGSLRHDGTAVMTDDVVMKSDIDSDELVFTPETGGSGSPYTTFTFKVNDGTVDSTDAYTMTVNVSAPATGAPTITGTAQVGRTLTAVTTGISDADGLTSPAYTYQWIRVNGMDADIPGANSSTYTLVDDDLGKTIRVRVTFDDDVGNAETLTSVPTAAVVAAATAHCSVPALIGRDVIWAGSLTVGVHPTVAGVLGFESGSFGSLDDRTFTVGAKDYTIGLVSLRGSSNLLLFATTVAGLAAREVAGLRLHVCAEDLDFSAAAGPSSGHAYIFSDAGLSWSSGDTVTLRLSLSATAAPGVTGVTVTSTPAAGDTYVADEAIEFTVAFTAPVTVTGAPTFAFGLGAATRQAAFTSGSNSAALAFAWTVQAGEVDRDGISWNANALALDGGTITRMGATTAASLTHRAQAARAGHRVDAAPPTLVSASVQGTALALVYDEALDPASRPAAGAYTVTATAGAVTTTPAVSAVSVDGSRVTLTLDTAPAAGATVTLAYAAPASSPVQDAVGNDAAAFSGQPVTLVVPPPPPRPRW